MLVNTAQISIMNIEHQKQMKHLLQQKGKKLGDKKYSGTENVSKTWTRDHHENQSKLIPVVLQ